MSAELDDLCAEITQQHKRRRYFVVQRMGLMSRLSFYVMTSSLDWSPDLSEAERAKVCKRADAILSAIEKEQLAGDDEAIADDIRDLALGTFAARETFDKQQAAIEREMTSLAKSLPTFDWQQSIKGFGELSHAKLIGETGSLSNYPHWRHVWKRMGLAVIKGERQRKKKSIEEAALHGYNPSRRSESWNMAQTLFRAQWRGEKDGVPAHPIGPYGEIYGEKKVEYLARVEATKDLPDRVGAFWNPEKWTPKRADNAARRFMEKALLRDLWLAWREATSRLESSGRISSTTPAMSDAAD